MPKTVILDDDEDVLRSAKMALRAVCGEIHTAGTISDFKNIISRVEIDVAVIDMNFTAGSSHGREGIDLLDWICAYNSMTSTIVMTAYGGVSLAVDSLKRGASDFILKPWRNDDLEKAVQAAGAAVAGRRAIDALPLEMVERNTIVRAIERHKGNISRAADSLGLTRPALYRRLVKHGL